MSIFKMGLMSAVASVCAVSVQAGVIFNPGDSFDDFSVDASFAPGDAGVAEDKGASGLAGDNAIQFVPRTNNNHILSWDVSGAVVDAADTLTLDVRNVLALGVATLTVRVYYDGLATPHSPVIPELTGNQLLTDAYQSITVSMPGGGNHTLDRIDFSITENTKVVTVDNLTLSTVPEPGSMALAGLGALAFVMRRKR